MKWEIRKLMECTEYITDGDHQPAPKANTGVLFIKIKDIHGGNIDFNNALYVPDEYYSALPNDRKPQYGDTLYTVVGSYGISAFVRSETKFCFERNIALLHPNPKINPLFLYYAVNTPSFYYQATNGAIGTAQKLISLSRLKQFTIQVPPHSIQNQIADILYTYDRLIDNNQKQINLLEEAAQRLYKEWFVDLRFPGYEKVPVVDGVPEGWAKDTVANVSSLLRRGISPQYADCANLRVINQKCIRTSIVDLSEARTQEKIFSGEMNLQDSDTVICSTGAGTLGRVGQVFGTYPDVTFDSHVTLVRANPVVGKQYLYHYLKSKQPFLMGMGKGSTNQLELGCRTIQDLPILVPNAQVVQGFERCTQPIHDNISVLVSEIERLRDVRDRLLPKLMSGELEV